MNLTLQVYEPEMSISNSFPRSKGELERELGFSGENSGKTS
jgi:hypothetical protein